MIIEDLADDIIDQALPSRAGGHNAVTPATQTAMCCADPDRAVTIGEQGPDGLAAQALRNAEASELTCFDAIQAVSVRANPQGPIRVLCQSPDIAAGSHSGDGDSGRASIAPAGQSTQGLLPHPKRPLRIFIQGCDRPSDDHVIGGTNELDLLASEQSIPCPHPHQPFAVTQDRPDMAVGESLC